MSRLCRYGVVAGGTLIAIGLGSFYMGPKTGEPVENGGRRQATPVPATG